MAGESNNEIISIPLWGTCDKPFQGLTAHLYKDPGIILHNTARTCIVLGWAWVLLGLGLWFTLKKFCRGVIEIIVTIYSISQNWWTVMICDTHATACIRLRRLMKMPCPHTIPAAQVSVSSTMHIQGFCIRCSCTKPLGSMKNLASFGWRWCQTVELIQMDPTCIAEGLRSWVLGHMVIPGALLLQGNVSTLVVIPE